jgi:glycosyltransferase involved in cell wall biosynthesis
VPTISVLMPVFNAAPYVESAVRSVLSQTFRDFELLIIDDGSSDASLSILERLASADARIRLTTRPNKGLVATLNELLAGARAPWLARMDADDLCRPTRFERQLQFLEANPSVVAVGSRVLFIDSEGLPLMEAMDRYTHEQIDAELLRPGLAIVHPSAMISAAACRAIGGFSDQYRHAEDLDFFLRLGEVGALANLDEPLLDYRIHGASVSHRFVDEQAQSARRAIEAALARRGVAGGRAAPSQQPASAFESKGALHRKWTWWALGAGHLHTARKHARLAILAEPFHPQGLLNLVFVLRDSLRGSR